MCRSLTGFGRWVLLPLGVLCSLHCGVLFARRAHALPKRMVQRYTSDNLSNDCPGFAKTTIRMNRQWMRSRRSIPSCPSVAILSIDDYNPLNNCKAAVNVYRERMGISEP